jgi:DNA-binding SARP family transcriptional activator
VRLQGGKLSLDRQKCWVDAWGFEKSVGGLRLEGTCDGTGVDLLERALRTYAGPFLPDDVDESWCAGVRERVQAKYIHALGYLARHLEAQERCEEAIAWYQWGLDADPLVETFYQGLMRCHHASGRRTEGIQAYRRLERLLSISLGVRPSAQSVHLHQTLRDESGEARP